MRAPDEMPDGAHMDSSQLKALAARLKSFLNSKGDRIRHNQALELISAIPGMRSWSEVVAFPARVAHVQVDDLAAHRLLMRIEQKRRVRVELLEILDVIDPVPAMDWDLAVWPDGPQPGIYVCTNQSAVEKTIGLFTANAPGSLIFCESFGCDADVAIDLGDSGVFSPGLKKAPRGSLVILGPLEFVDESWEDLGDRLRTAANLVTSAGHRVVVLAKTPAHSQLRFDMSLLVRWKDCPEGYVDDTLRGTVADDGTLMTMDPFVDCHAEPIATTINSKHAFPGPLSALLTSALEHKPFGIVAVCGGMYRDRFEFAESALPLIAKGRPVARIQPDFRGGYGEPPLSDSFAGLQVCPSIEAAYARGYRVMIMEKAFYSEAMDRILAHANDCVFVIPNFGSVEVMFARGIIVRKNSERAAVDKIIAVLCAADIPSSTGTHVIYDAYIARADIPQPSGNDRVLEFASDNRVIAWEAEVLRLLDEQLVSAAELVEPLRGFSQERIKHHRAFEGEVA
jgi:hypothetical protein